MLEPPGTRGPIRDLIYFDDKKASSLLSQIEGGLPMLTHTTEEAASGSRSGHTLDLRLVKTESGETANDRLAVVEERVLHHALLSRVERWLTDAGVLAVVDDSAISLADGYEGIRETILRHSFAEITGHAILQDFRELASVMRQFNDLADFMGKANEYGLKSDPSYVALREQLDELETTSRESNTARDKRAQLKLQVSELRRALDARVKEASSVGTLPSWLPEGIGLFVDAFLKGQIQMRVQPMLAHPEFEAICTLKRDCFLDADITNVIQAYGSRPVAKLSILGFLTSAPGADGQVGDRATRSSEGELSGAFEQMFGALEKLEDIMSMSRYPRITVYPIAVYRHLSVGHLKQAT